MQDINDLLPDAVQILEGMGGGSYAHDALVTLNKYTDQPQLDDSQMIAMENSGDLSKLINDLSWAP